MRPFEPLFRNPHVLTILGNFWLRGHDFTPYPVENRFIRTDEDTQVLVQTQRPEGKPVGEVVLVHGLEGDGNSGYIHSMAFDALNAGFIAHRFHMRTCGGTENLCKTLYHGGLTSDLRSFLEQTRAEGRGVPLFLIGFSLGGNVSLKLAGELGETDLIAGVCAVSTPIDLGAGARRLRDPENRIYERRFVDRMRKRVLATGRFTATELNSCKTLYELDDRITAPSFGFQGAEHYYSTQSSIIFLNSIRVPTLLVHAKDDTFIPFEMYERAGLAANGAPSGTHPNKHLRLIVTEHGGHLGFLARRSPRFWVDEIAIGFLQQVISEARADRAAAGSRNAR